MVSEAETKTMQVPLDKEFLRKLEISENRERILFDFIKNKFPNIVVEDTRFIAGLPFMITRTASTNDAIVIAIKYHDKSQDEIFCEQIEYLISTLSVQKSDHKKHNEYGCCPECGRKILNWKPVFGSFAPEWWATMRQSGIDPSTGHSLYCSIKLKLRQ